MHNDGFLNGQYDVVVVGGGIVGAATFYKLQKRFPERRMLLIDKMPRLADHQTGNNSGVIHSGLYYKRWSLKATNCVQGRQELVQFCKEHDVPHDVCGKVVVATDESELPMLEKIHGIGQQNEIENLERIDADQLREIEPHCKGVAAFGRMHRHCGFPERHREDGCRSPRHPTQQRHSTRGRGRPRSRRRRLVIRTTVAGELARTYHADKVVVCAGLQADRLARKDGVALKERVVGFRGDYYELEDHAKHKVRNLIYPVPNPDFPFLGVHFTRLTDGEIECGLNAGLYVQARRLRQD